MKREFASFSEFYPFYLEQHSKRGTRWVHFIGTGIGNAVGLYGLFAGRLLLVPVAFLVGYAFAWTSHFLIEGNRPATFGHPFWSFLSDYRMAFGLIKDTFRGN